MYFVGTCVYCVRWQLKFGKNYKAKRTKSCNFEKVSKAFKKRWKGCKHSTFKRTVSQEIYLICKAKSLLFMIYDCFYNCFHKYCSLPRSALKYLRCPEETYTFRVFILYCYCTSARILYVMRGRQAGREWDYKLRKEWAKVEETKEREDE